MTKLPPLRISDPKAFGSVAVLMGGTAAERDISLQSGAAVVAALKSRGVDAHGIDAADGLLSRLQDGGFDRVFVSLHGRGGEDGTVQGALEILALPYTGSGVLGSALAMDKLRCKQLWQGVGLPTPSYQVVNNSSDFAAVERALGLPLIVKPAREGSSIGMSKVCDPAQLAHAVRLACEADDVVIAERWITGSEYTVAVLQGCALPPIRLETPHEFYDFDAKYRSDQTLYHCPCGLSKKTEQELQQLAMEAFFATGSTGWGRVDFMFDEKNDPWLLEVNTVPGMTDHSLVPMAARSAGLTFDELVWRILETSL